MNSHDKTRVVAGAIALILFAISYVILSALIIEVSMDMRCKLTKAEAEIERLERENIRIVRHNKAAPVQEVQSQYPEIPKCDKELWLRIKDGCP